MATVLLLNGPNLNLLGTREPQHYGSTSLKIIETKLQGIAKQHGHTLACFQSNAEHELVNRIHAAQQEAVVFILINAAALTHTSIALRDALSTVAIPFIEIHISNIYARESFRHHSYLADIAVGQISGLGGKGYELALLAAIERIANDVA